MAVGLGRTISGRITIGGKAELRAVMACFLAEPETLPSLLGLCVVESSNAPSLYHAYGSVHVSLSPNRALRHVTQTLLL